MFDTFKYQYQMAVASNSNSRIVELLEIFVEK